MLLTRRQRLQAELETLSERYGRDRSALLPVLQEIKLKYKDIFPYSMQLIADHLGIHPVEVYGVTSFYSFLGKPEGKFVIRLCSTISCDMAGKERLARQLCNDLGIGFGETTPDGLFSLRWASCLGMCDQGPALLVNEQVHTRLTPEKLHEILGDCRRSFGAHATQKEGH
jgi:[NiFe] hydrogenase diaphorase moiety large subunit